MKKGMTPKPAVTVNEYMERLPEPVRTTLEQIRKAIKEAAPLAEEGIGYGMPGYKYHGPLAYFAAFKNHCSYFPAGFSVIQQFSSELKKYEVDKGTIRFPLDKPLPAALVKKMVRAKMAENEARAAAKKLAKAKPVKAKVPKPTDAEQVSAFMGKLKHPLQEEIETVRKIIKKINPKITERIKWNAPSYYYKTEKAETDFVTFNPRAQQHVHLVFHHAAIATIKSPLLQGDYKDRRMVYFTNMKAIKAGKKELERVITELLKKI